MLETGVAEDGSTPASDRSGFLLDRLLYKGVLPRYAFPTDVVSFHVFDPDNSTRLRDAYRYAPSQGLAVALTQYAPGKVVWIDKNEWTSGALYAPVRAELSDAWRNRKLYFACRDCGFARVEEFDRERRGAVEDCPACLGTQFGPAMTWMRPPGFAHRVDKDPVTSPDDEPVRSYATRAKLFAPGPSDDSRWKSISDGISQTYQRAELLVTNAGPDEKGYSYCTRCGIIEPTAIETPTLSGSHPKPYPDSKEQTCLGGGTTRHLALGTDFISDVLLIRVTVALPVTLQPSFLATKVALRTVAEALVIAATRKLEIEPTELQAEYRPALTPHGSNGLQAEIYLYDTLPGGAGFTHRVNELGRGIYEEALELLENCPVNCDESCYRCLRSFRNRFEHSELDRHVGASLLRYLLDGTLPQLAPERLERSATKLFEYLDRAGVEGVTFTRNTTVSVPEVGEVVAPILARRGSQEWIIGIHDPLTLGVAPTPELAAALDRGSAPNVVLCDDLVISRNLPKAMQMVLDDLR